MLNPELRDTRFFHVEEGQTYFACTAIDRDHTEYDLSVVYRRRDTEEVDGWRLKGLNQAYSEKRPWLVRGEKLVEETS